MSKDTFLKNITVLDTETTSQYPNEAEIVELAVANYDGNNWITRTHLMGSRDPIPPAASAKNHISQRMIAGLPTFKESISIVTDMMNWPNSAWYVAHNSKYDQEVLAKAWLEVGDQKSAISSLNNKMWICTYRLARQLLVDGFTDMQYNLSFLRYKLDLPVPDDMASHRADADTLVCAVLFEFLVDYALATDRITDGNDIGEQLHHICWQPIIYSVWPFGKYKGKSFSEIPDDYFLWAMKNIDSLNDAKSEYDPDLAASLAAELEKRFT